MDAVRSSCGALRRINASFCFPAHRREGFFEDNIRATGADPLGSLGDLGWCDPDRNLSGVQWQQPVTRQPNDAIIVSVACCVFISTVRYTIRGILVAMDW